MFDLQVEFTALQLELHKAAHATVERHQHAAGEDGVLPQVPRLRLYQVPGPVQLRHLVRQDVR